MSSNNIFIFGLPRSGTTWLAKILDSHPDTLLRHEPDTVHSTSAFPFVLPSDNIDQYLAEARNYLQDRTHDRELRCVSGTPHFPKSYRAGVLQKFREGIIWCARAADFLFRGALDRKFQVPDLISRGSSPVNVVKSVDSVARLPLFASACPEDKFLFIIRHPCGVVGSKFRGRKLGKIGAGAVYPEWLDFDTARDLKLTASDLESWSTVEASAWGWVLTNDSILTLKSSLPNMLVINYDELCESPIAYSKTIFEWAELSWSAQTEDYIRQCISKAPDSSVGYYSTQQNPANAANKWKKELSDDQIEAIMSICGKSKAGALFTGK